MSHIILKELATLRESTALLLGKNIKDSIGTSLCLSFDAIRIGGLWNLSNSSLDGTNYENLLYPHHNDSDVFISGRAIISDPDLEIVKPRQHLAAMPPLPSMWLSPR